MIERRSIRLPGTCCVPIRRHRGGYLAEGPGFYVWDESPEAVLSALESLERGRFRADRAIRLMMPESDGASAEG